MVGTSGGDRDVREVAPQHAVTTPDPSDALPPPAHQPVGVVEDGTRTQALLPPQMHEGRATDADRDSGCGIRGRTDRPCMPAFPADALGTT